MSTFAVGLLLWLGATFLLGGAWFGGRSLANRLFGLPPPPCEGASAVSRRHYGGVVLGPLAAYLACSAVALATGIAFGVPTPTLVVNILPGSPAAHAGMISGDRIVSIDGRPVQTWEEALAILQSKPAPTVRVAVNRSSEEVLVVATTNERGRLGLESQYEQAHAGLAFALRYALTHPAWIVTDTFRGLSQWIIGNQKIEVVDISDLGSHASKGSSGHAPFFLFAFMSAYLWPGVWLLEATFWWARRARPVVAAAVKLASRWRRFLAAVIDASLLAVVVLIGGVVAVPLSRSEAIMTASTFLVALAWLTVRIEPSPSDVDLQATPKVLTA
jgi:hypothetical protein